MSFPIASANLALESCAITTFKPCIENCFSSQMKIVRRSLLSLFTMTVLFYVVSNRERESRVGPMRQHNIQTLLIEVLCLVFESCKTFSSINIHYKSIVLCDFQSQAGILRWNHALAQHLNLSLQKFYLFVYECCKTFSAIIFTLI